MGVRLSVYDFVPFRPGPDGEGGKPGTGVPEPFEEILPYQYGFGIDPGDPLEIDLDEPRRFIAALGEWGVDLVNLTCGSPYYNPHIQRPALFVRRPTGTSRPRTRWPGGGEADRRGRPG